MIPDVCFEALRAGGLIAFPTDTLFALSCDALHPDAVNRLRRVKGTGTRPLPVLIPPQFDVADLDCLMNSAAAELTARYWPGKLTVVMPCTGTLARHVGRAEDGAVGLRVPDHPVALEILTRWRGPLVGTSANRAGGTPATRDDEVKACFGSEVQYVATGSAPGSLPSTVVVVVDDRITLEREGAIPAAELARWVDA